MNVRPFRDASSEVATPEIKKLIEQKMSQYDSATTEDDNPKAAAIRRASVRGGRNVSEAEGVLAIPAPTSMKVRVRGMTAVEEKSVNLDPGEYLGMSIMECRTAIMKLCLEENFVPDDVNSSAQELFDAAQLMEAANAMPKFGFDVTV